MTRDASTRSAICSEATIRHAAYLKPSCPHGMNAARTDAVIEPTRTNAWLTITRRKQDFKLKDTPCEFRSPLLRSCLRSL